MSMFNHFTVIPNIYIQLQGMVYILLVLCAWNAFCPRIFYVCLHPYTLDHNLNVLSPRKPSLATWDKVTLSPLTYDFLHGPHHELIFFFNLIYCQFSSTLFHWNILPETREEKLISILFPTHSPYCLEPYHTYSSYSVNFVDEWINY